MADGFVGYSEFTDIVTDHFGFDVQSNEFFAVVNVDFGADHLGQDDHVSDMGLHGDFLTFFACFLGCSHFLQKYALLGG